MSGKRADNIRPYNSTPTLNRIRRGGVPSPPETGGYGNRLYEPYPTSDRSTSKYGAEMREYGDSHIRQGVLRLTVCSFYERPESVRNHPDFKQN